MLLECILNSANWPVGGYLRNLLNTHYICHGRTPPIFVMAEQEGSTNWRNVICLEFLGKKSGGNLLNVTVKSQPILAASLPAVLALESLEYTLCKAFTKGQQKVGKYGSVFLSPNRQTDHHVFWSIKGQSPPYIVHPKKIPKMLKSQPEDALVNLWNL